MEYPLEAYFFVGLIALFLIIFVVYLVKNFKKFISDYLIPIFAVILVTGGFFILCALVGMVVVSFLGIHIPSQ
jgi:hypothetical protein